MPHTASRTGPSYSNFSIALHWLMLLLLAAVYATIEFREMFPRGSDPREALKALHFSLGLSVLVLVWVRLVARIGSPSRPVPPSWSERLAAAMHLALYVLMIGMPLLGWVAMSADGKPVLFFGVELPALVAKDKVLADQVEEIHEIFGVVGYWLIAGHAAAALAHHYVLRDGTLQRMLPGRT